MLRRVLVVLALFLSASVLPSGAGVHADAEGSTLFSNGHLFGIVKGSGTTVNAWQGTFTVVGNVCNWHFRFHHWDHRNVLRGVDSTPRLSGCHVHGTSGRRTLGGWGGSGWNFGSGRVCISLMENSRARATTCFSVHP
jgi:hypothetical protein